MKRILIYVAWASGTLVLLIGAVFIGTFSGLQSVPESVEESGISVISDGLIGVALVPVGVGKVALIDTGNDESGKAILAELSRRQLAPDAVSAIFFTHGHFDHIAATHLFPKAHIYALAPEVGLIEGSEGATGPVLRVLPVRSTGIKVTHPLQDGQVVSFEGTSVTVYAMPGHTHGSAAYLVNGVLFLGDSADATKGGTLQGAHWIFSDSLPTNEQSLIALEGRLRAEGVSIRALHFAHSGILQGRDALAEYARSRQ